MTWLVAVVLAQATVADGGLDRRTRTLMHTEVTLALPRSVDASAREAAFAEGFGVFEHIEQELNEWKPGSALSRINGADGGTPVVASAEV